MKIRCSRWIIGPVIVKEIVYATNDHLSRRTFKNDEQYGYSEYDEQISTDNTSYAYDGEEAQDEGFIWAPCCPIDISNHSRPHVLQSMPQ